MRNRPAVRTLQSKHHLRTNVTWVVVSLEVLFGANLPSNQGTAELRGTNGHSQDFKKEGSHGADLVKMTDGWTNILGTGVEERMELKGLLRHKKSHHLKMNVHVCEQHIYYSKKRHEVLSKSHLPAWPRGRG